MSVSLRKSRHHLNKSGWQNSELFFWLRLRHWRRRIADLRKAGLRACLTLRKEDLWAAADLTQQNCFVPPRVILGRRRARSGGFWKVEVNPIGWGWVLIYLLIITLVYIHCVLASLPDGSDIPLILVPGACHDHLPFHGVAWSILQDTHKCFTYCIYFATPAIIPMPPSCPSPCYHHQPKHPKFPAQSCNSRAVEGKSSQWPTTN